MPQQIPRAWVIRMEEIEINVNCKYTTDNVWPNNWRVNPTRYRNWAAKTELNNDTGKEERVYLDGTEDDDCFWCVAGIKKYDVLAFGIYDTIGHNTDRAYYLVMEMTECSMRLLSEDGLKGFTTIRETLKALEKWKTKVKNNNMI